MPNLRLFNRRFPRRRGGLSFPQFSGIALQAQYGKYGAHPTEFFTEAINWPQRRVRAWRSVMIFWASGERSESFGGRLLWITAKTDSNLTAFLRMSRISSRAVSSVTVWVSASALFSTNWSWPMNGIFVGSRLDRIYKEIF